MSVSESTTTTKPASTIKHPEGLHIRVGVEHFDHVGVRGRLARPNAKRRELQLFKVYDGEIFLTTHLQRRLARRHIRGEPVVTFHRREGYRLWRGRGFQAFTISGFGSLKAAREAADLAAQEARSA